MNNQEHVMQELTQLRQEVARLKTVEARYAALTSTTAAPNLPANRGEYQFRESFEVVPIPMIISRMSDGLITYANNYAGTMVGLSTQQLIGQHSFNFYVDPDQRNFILEAIQCDGYLFNYEVKLKRANGEIFWVLASLQAMDFENELSLFTGMYEITSQKKAEEDLRLSELQFRAILNAMPDLIFSVHRDGTLLDFHGGHDTRMYKVIKDVVGKNLMEVLPPNLAEQRRYYLEQAFQTGELQFFEFDIETDRGLRHEEGRFVVSGDDWALHVVRDVTAHKEAELMLARRARELETVSQLSAAASTILDTDKLLQQVTSLTKSRFGLYHAHIYLFSPDTDMLNLAAGAGEVGQKMVAQGWSIPLFNEKSLVARAARTYEGVIENNVRSAPDWLPNPLLPDTRAEMAVPMIVGDSLLGVLDVQADKEDFFTAEDVYIQTTLAAQVGVALQNARLHAQMQAALSKTEALYRGSDLIIRARSMNDVLQALVETTSLQQLERATVLFFNRPWADQPPESMVVAAVWEKPGTPKYDTIGTVYQLYQLPVVKYLERNSPTFFADITTDPRTDESFYKLMVTQLGMRSIVAFSLVAGDEWIGIMTGQSSQPLSISADEIRHIHSFADQSAIVFQSQRLFEQTQQSLAKTERQARQLAVLNEFAAALNNAATATEIFKLVAQKVPEIIESRQVGVAFIKPDDDSLFELFTLSGLDGLATTGLVFPLKNTAIGQAIRQGNLALVPDAADSEFLDAEKMHQFGQRSIINAPMVVGGQLIGALTVATSQANAYTLDEANMFRQVASLVGSSIQNQRLLDQAQSRAQHEQVLRQITSRVRSTNNPDIILRTAIRELGLVLNRSTFVKMSDSQTRPASPEQLNEVNNG